MGHFRSRCILTVMALLFSPFAALAAGSLDNPGAPELGSAMPTTSEIYNLIVSRTPITPSATFREPVTGPTAGSGSRTLAEIQAALEARLLEPDSNGVLPSQVPYGKTFWSLNMDAWGPQTGSNVNMVDTTEAIEPARPSDISCGRKAYVNGALVTGTYGCQ